MTCTHKSAVGLCKYRTTRVPNRQRGRMYTFECLNCGLLPITWPLGSAKAKRPGKGELQLADAIASMSELYSTDEDFFLQEVDRLAAFLAAV